MELVDGQPLSALLRPGEPLDPDAVRDLLPRPATRSAPPTGPGSCTATSSRPTFWSRPRAGQDHRLRHRPRQRGPRPDRDRPGHGHPAVPLARAGPRARSPPRPPTSTRSAWSRSSASPAAGRSRPSHPSPPRWPTSSSRSPTCPPSVPADLATVVRRAGQGPRERYPDGSAFAAALRDPATAATQVVAPAPVPVPAPGRCRTGRLEDDLTAVRRGAAHLAARARSSSR